MDKRPQIQQGTDITLAHGQFCVKLNNLTILLNNAILWPLR